MVGSFLGKVSLCSAIWIVSGVLKQASPARWVAMVRVAKTSDIGTFLRAAD
ncbi:MAG: hypothetical protein ACXWP0_14835 [Ktedonobacterales bacterium]